MHRPEFVPFKTSRGVKTTVKRKVPTVLALVAAMTFLFGMLALSDAFAYSSMSPDGKTCTPCHTDGRTGGAPAKAAEPAKEAPAKAAPAKAAPAPAPAPAPKVNATLQVTAFGKQAAINGQASGKALLVPVRAVGDLFYAKVDWNAKAKTVSVLYQGKSGSMTLNKDKATINGKEVALGAKAQTVKGQTFVPVDFFAQIVGTEMSGDTSKGFALNAALPGYAGSQTCSKCHQGQYKDWQNTRHSEMLQNAEDPNAWVIGNFATNSFFKFEDVDFLVGNGMEGGQRYVKSVDGQLMYMTATWDAENRIWKKANPSKYTCAGCHTAGLNPKTGSWAENGITCESCHGPGAAHAKAPSKSNIKNSTGMDMCNSCHGADRQDGALAKMWVPEGEEKTGGHAGLFAHEIDNVTSPDYHYSDRCMKCHSATYIVAVAKGKTPPKYDDFMKGGLKSDRNGITCAACHDPHKNTGFEFQLRKDPVETCTQCHDAPDHHPSATVMTKGGPIYKADGSTTYVGASKEATCEQCHMIEGNHSFTPAVLAITSHGATTTYNACAACHTQFGPASDIDPKTGKPAAALTEQIKQGQAAMRAVQAEVEEEFEPLKERQAAVQAKFDALKAADPNSAVVKEAEPYITASFKNVEIFENDGSKGIHNMQYVEANFAQLEEDLAKAESLLP